MSALSPKADLRQCKRHVRFLPETVVIASRGRGSASSVWYDALSSKTIHSSVTTGTDEAARGYPCHRTRQDTGSGLSSSWRSLKPSSAGKEARWRRSILALPTVVGYPLKRCINWEPCRGINNKRPPTEADFLPHPIPELFASRWLKKPAATKIKLVQSQIQNQAAE